MLAIRTIPLLLGSVLIGGAAVAQGPTPKSLPDAPTPQNGVQPRSSEGPILGELQKSNVAEPNQAPLTVARKWHFFEKHTFQPSLLIAAAASAGIKQGLDSPTEYGPGAEGYGKRFGATLANAADGSFWESFVLPALFREDPRYFRMREGGTMSRIQYAATRAVLTRTDSGDVRFNFSNVLGNLVSASISNAYYPRDDRSVKDTFQRAAIGLGIGALRRVGQEFFPDLHHKLFHRKQKSTDSDPSPGTVGPPH